MLIARVKRSTARMQLMVVNKRAPKVVFPVTASHPDVLKPHGRRELLTTPSQSTFSHRRILSVCGYGAVSCFPGQEVCSISLIAGVASNAFDSVAKRTVMRHPSVCPVLHLHSTSIRHESQDSQQSTNSEPVSKRDLRNLRASTPTPPKSEETPNEKAPTGKLRNEAIPVLVARLVNPETGSLGEAVVVRDVLATIPRKTHCLELVTREPEPIVKIISLKEEYVRKRAKQAQRLLNRAPEEKEVQLSWNVAPSDLRFKLRKAHEDLADGHRVTIVFASKSKQPSLKPEAQQAIIDDTMRILADVGKEQRPVEVKKNTSALFMESIRPRKQVLELEWVHEGEEEHWVGMNAVESALRKGGRVDVVFLTPSPPKKKDAQTLEDAKTVDPEVVKQRIEDTVARLQELGQEWRDRDMRKTSLTVYFEGRRVS